MEYIYIYIYFQELRQKIGQKCFCQNPHKQGLIKSWNKCSELPNDIKPSWSFRGRMLERRYLQVGIKKLQDIIKYLPLKIKEFEYLIMLINYIPRRYSSCLVFSSIICQQNQWKIPINPSWLIKEQMKQVSLYRCQWAFFFFFFDRRCHWVLIKHKGHSIYSN